MKKVLFTDLFNTLISFEGHRYFNSKNKEMEIVCRYISQFLKDGNYVAIVTSPGGHGHLNESFNNVLISINNFLNTEGNIRYYLQVNDKDLSNNNIKQINEKKYYFFNSDVYGICIKRKEDAIIDFLTNFEMPYEIYAIGDSSRDIPMLLKAKELGGKSSLMDTGLYRRNMTIDEIIENQLEIEFHFEYKKIIENMSIEEKMEGLSPELVLLYKKREQRKQYLYQELYAGHLNLQELYENYSKFIECKDYHELITSPFSETGDLYRNYSFNENIINEVMSMPCHSSFANYYTKVLKR